MKNDHATPQILHRSDGISSKSNNNLQQEIHKVITNTEHNLLITLYEPTTVKIWLPMRVSMYTGYGLFPVINPLSLTPEVNTRDAHGYPEKSG